MKIKTLERNQFNKTRNERIASINDNYQDVKKAVKSKVNKETLQVSILYVLSILSISSWIISLKILPFGDSFQFLLGAVVLGVNLMVFKYTKA